MKKFIFLLFLFCKVYAQTGIGTTAPHVSAKLDVSATNKGFLPPRVTLTSVTDVATINSPAEGLLVYNLGSIGLQAGYYYWNGANWATIATGTTAGNAVVASDLVKLYNESYSIASGKIAHANGYGFTVPVSGRYLFDFSSSGYLNQAVMSITFKVRQGTTDLGTDIFSNANNNVHVVFTGMIEVNLQAGITYNVFVSSSGSRDAGDYDRVHYKMVSGNLPVNQHIAERNIQLSNNYLSNDGGNEGIRIDDSGNVGIGTISPTNTLDVTGSMGVSGVATLKGLVKVGTGLGDEGGEINFAVPQTNTTLSTRVVTDIWQNRFRIFDGNTNGVYIDLSKAPTGVGGELLTKASGFVNAGDYVTLGNIKARIPTSGNRSLQLATVSGTYNVYGSGVHVFSSNVGSTTIDGSAPRTISTTPAYLNSGNTFGTAGGTDTWNIMDTTNFIGWRISCIIGGGYFANLITIERLF